jgi:hypothetical protein
MLPHYYFLITFVPSSYAHGHLIALQVNRWQNEIVLGGNERENHHSHHRLTSSLWDQTITALPTYKMCTMFLKLISYKIPAQLQISNGKCLSMQQETRFHCDGFLLDWGGWNTLWNCDHNLVGKCLKLGLVNMHNSCKRASKRKWLFLIGPGRGNQW